MIPGGSKIGGAVLEGVGKQLAKHTPLDEVAQRIAPDLYHLITGEQVLGNMKARSKAHPGAFSNDFQGAMQTGKLQEYINRLPDQTKENFTGYFKGLDPDNQADFTDLLGRGANQEPDALHAIHMADKTLTLEKTYQANNKKYNNIRQQPTETAAAPEGSAPKEKQVRTQSVELIDDLNAEVHGEDWSKLAEEGQDKLGRSYKGEGGQTIESGQSIFVAQRTQELSPHHLSELAFDLKAIENWPRAEQLQFIRDMNSIDVFPGRHPRNWLGLFHDNTRTIQARQQAEIQKLRREAGMPPLTKREVDNWYKKDAHGPDEGTDEFPMLGKDELESDNPELNRLNKKHLARGSIKRDWSQILPPGKTIKDIEVAPAVISRDHQEFVHGITNRLPSTKRIKELLASGEWDALPYNDRITMLMRNAVEKQAVAFNVALMRINLIREAMGKPNASWDDIVAWMAKNPERAASIDWHGQISRGGNLYNQLNTTPTAILKPVSQKDMLLISQVFNMTEPPNSAPKFQQWLKANR